jgi:hypothetical protein
VTTFSQLVDLMVKEVRRPDMLAEVCTYLNQTIREVHFEPLKNNIIFFTENLMEAVVTATTNVGTSWDIPYPNQFQAMKTVRFDSQWDGLRQVYPKMVVPGRIMASLRWYYYRAGGTFFFNGNGGIGSTISLAYYEFPKRLKYYADSARPATWDDDTGWTYDPSFDIDDAHRLAARQFCGNWLLDRWEDVISEGLRAKVYKRTSDTDRARTCYSSYTSLREGLYTSEMEPGGGG